MGACRAGRGVELLSASAHAAMRLLECAWIPPCPPAACARALMVYHKAALVATRDFWRQLMHDVIVLERLASSFKRIDEMEGMADKTYKLVLERCVVGVTGGLFGGGVGLGSSA